MDIVNPILMTAMSPLTGTAAAPPATMNVAAPEAGSAAYFAQLMNAPPPPAPVAVSQTTPGVSAASVTSAPYSAQSMGDQILAGMQSVSMDLQTSWNSISGTLEAAETVNSTAGLLKAQLNIAQLSLQYQFIGSATTWVTDGINQLVKMQ